MKQDLEIIMKYLVKKMDLNNINWNKENYNKLLEYMLSFQYPLDRITRASTIINTNLKVLGLYNKELMDISKHIKNTKIEEFLNLVNFEYFELTMIYGNLLPYLDSFELISKYLDVLINNMDNWATCDNIPFKLIIKKYESELFNKALELCKGSDTFARRVGIKIFFEYINIKDYNKIIFKELNRFSKEEEYYVNMVIGWLLATMLYKTREETLLFMDKTKLNQIAKNIFVQKSRDSFKVRLEDKEYILKYKG